MTEFEASGIPTGDTTHDGQQVQPPNWMGLDQFSEKQNSDINFGKAVTEGKVPAFDEEHQRLYDLIGKMAKLLDEKESSSVKPGITT